MGLRVPFTERTWGHGGVCGNGGQCDRGSRLAGRCYKGNLSDKVLFFIVN